MTYRNKQTKKKKTVLWICSLVVTLSFRRWWCGMLGRRRTWTHEILALGRTKFSYLVIEILLAFQRKTRWRNDGWKIACIGLPLIVSKKIQRSLWAVDSILHCDDSWLKMWESQVVHCFNAFQSSLFEGSVKKLCPVVGRYHYLTILCSY